MNVRIEVIPHDQQRYSTCGDWYFEPNGEDLIIRVSKLSDPRFEALVAVHELVEVLLCKQNGVTQEAVDKYDMEFENYRQAAIDEAAELGHHEDKVELQIAEPGDQKDAPYRIEHCFATGVERLLAANLGVVWADYEKELESLP